MSFCPYPPLVTMSMLFHANKDFTVSSESPLVRFGPAASPSHTIQTQHLQHATVLSCFLAVALREKGLCLGHRHTCPAQCPHRAGSADEGTSA